MDIKFILVIFLIGFLVFITPTTLRWINGTGGIIGITSYYHTRMSENILSLNFKDHMSFQGRGFTYPPGFSFILAFFSLFLGASVGSVAASAFLGGVSSVLIYLIGKEILKDFDKVYVLLFIFTPGVIYLYSHASPVGGGITFALASFYLLLKEKWLICSLFLGLVFLVHPIVGIVFLIINSLYSYKKHINKKTLVKMGIILFLVGFLWYAYLFSSQGLPETTVLYEEYRQTGYSLDPTGIDNYFWEFNSFGILNIALFGLSLFGFYKTKNKFLRIWFLLTLILSFLATRFLIYFIIPTILLCFKGADKKRIFYLAIIYTVIAGIGFSFMFSSHIPTERQYNAFMWIKQNTEENVTVISPWEWGHWVTGISKRKSFVDGYIEYAPNIKERINDLEKLRKQCNQSIINKYGIDYMYIDKDWWKTKQNMSCISKFDIIYNKTDIQIFKLR